MRDNILMIVVYFYYLPITNTYTKRIFIQFLNFLIFKLFINLNTVYMVTVYNFGYAENRTLEPKPDDLAALRPLPRQIINHFRKSFSEESDIDSNCGKSHEILLNLHIRKTSFRNSILCSPTRF